MFKEILFDLLGFADKLQYYIDLDTALMLCSVAMVIIIFLIPSYWRPVIRIYSDNIKSFFKIIFWTLTFSLVVFNFFLYFSQPDYQNLTIGVERQAKDVQIRTFESDKILTMTRHLYDFLEKRPDDRFFTYTTVWLWKNIFLINNIAISIIVIYTFVTYIFLE